MEKTGKKENTEKTAGISMTDVQNMDKQTLASYIDHTLLKPEAGKSRIDALCDEAAEYKFCSVCINPVWVAHCAERLAGTGVKVCTVVGFPLGAVTSETKVQQTVQAVQEGADEIDMVINIGALKDADAYAFEQDIREVRRACSGKLLKVIIETCLLTEDEKITACRAAQTAGADFVKTSTGFSTGGALTEDVALMRKTVGPEMGVKASGGIRSFEDARAMIEAGATRLGASSGVAILNGLSTDSDY